MRFGRRKNELDPELAEFRSIMEAPGEFEDGFSLSSLLGTIFVALVMVPGALYMELVAGMGIGSAAQWVTVLLFVEVAKRANARLSRAQLFILFYMSGILLGQSVYGMPLFQQFVVRSDAAVATGVSSLIPHWVAPPDLDSLKRTFLQKAWLPALGLIIFRGIFSHFENAVLGYGLFRVANDIERLPFPMAPVGAQGIVAVAEQVEGAVKSAGMSLRWRMFCIGAGVGMVFGLVYMALPTLTGAFFGRPVMVFPIPFADFCNFTYRALPAVATGMTFDLGQFIMGMVLPYYAMLGSFIGLLFTFVANPILYRMGYMQTWRPGDKTVDALFANNIDFYFSFGIGLALAIALYGIFNMVRSVRGRRREDAAAGTVSSLRHGVKGRGDIPNWLMIGTYIVSVSMYIAFSGWLIGWDRGVMIVLCFFGFLYTPVISYVTACLEGLAGQVIEIPFVRELAFILSGYKGVAIWFIPIPRANYGTQVVRLKQAELLGCKFTAIWKSTFILVPIMYLSMVCFSSFIWSLAEIPSAVYPFTQEIWEFQARNACLVYSSTLGEYSQFQEALDGGRVLLGLGTGVGAMGVLSFLGAPTMLFFGLVRGLNQTLPHSVIPSFIGAVLGKYYFQRKFGREWRKMIPVISAGFFVGGGLISILSIGFVFLAKAVTTVPY